MSDEEDHELEEFLDERRNWRTSYFAHLALMPGLLTDLCRLIDERKRNYRKPRNISRKRIAHRRNLRLNVMERGPLEESFRVPLVKMIGVLEPAAFETRLDFKSIIHSLRRQLFTGEYSLFDLMFTKLRTRTGRSAFTETTLRYFDADFKVLRDVFEMMAKWKSNGVIQGKDGLHISSRRIRIIYDLLQSCDGDSLRGALRSVWSMTARRDTSKSLGSAQVEPVASPATETENEVNNGPLDPADSFSLEIGESSLSSSGLSDRQYEKVIERVEILLATMADERLFPYAVFHRWSFVDVSKISPAEVRFGSPRDQVVFEIGNGLIYLSTHSAHFNFLRNVHSDRDLVEAIYGQSTEFTHANAWRTLADSVSKCMSIAWKNLSVATVTQTLSASELPDLPAGDDWIDIPFMIEDVFGNTCMVNLYCSLEVFSTTEEGQNDQD